MFPTDDLVLCIQAGEPQPSRQGIILHIATSSDGKLQHSNMKHVALGRWQSFRQRRLSQLPVWRRAKEPGCIKTQLYSSQNRSQSPYLALCCAVQMYQLLWAPLRSSSTRDRVSMIQVSIVQLLCPCASAFMHLLTWGAVSKRKIRRLLFLLHTGEAWLKVRQERVTQALILNCRLQDRN